jgi:hypothetical protein
MVWCFDDPYLIDRNFCFYYRIHCCSSSSFTKKNKENLLFHLSDNRILQRESSMDRRIYGGSAVIHLFLFFSVLIFSAASALSKNQSPSSGSGQINSNSVLVALLDSRYTELAELVEKALLLQTLEDAVGRHNITIFAPRNEALERDLDPEFKRFLLEPGNLKSLQTLLMFHIIPNRVLTNKIFFCFFSCLPESKTKPSDHKSKTTHFSITEIFLREEEEEAKWPQAHQLCSHQPHSPLQSPTKTLTPSHSMAFVPSV